MAFNVVTISGSLRKRSFNTALMRSLPALAPADLDLSEAPPYDRMPLYMLIGVGSRRRSAS
jgi:chromate reductase